MALIRSRQVDPGIIGKTPCRMNHACLSGQSVCRVEPFVDRDVQLLRCRDRRACAFRKNYRGMSICMCPVNRASYGLD
jgi:hypothetical protein